MACEKNISLTGKSRSERGEVLNSSELLQQSVRRFRIVAPVPQSLGAQRTAHRFRHDLVQLHLVELPAREAPAPQCEAAVTGER